MKTVTGKSFCIGDKGWYFGPHISKHMRPRIGQDSSGIMRTGIRFDAFIGYIVRPVSKWYHWRLWKAVLTGNKYGKMLFNPWNSGNHWFVLRIPFRLPVLFISASIIIGKFNPGGYLGFRTALVDNNTHRKAEWADDGEVLRWCDEYAWGNESENGNIYAEPTACLRMDMRK